MYLIDIDCLSNGIGKKAYSGSLEAYSFYETNCNTWFNQFMNDVVNALGKRYLPVYRIGDGELRFLFGPKVNWKNKPIRSLMNFVKYRILKAKWKTSWGENYNQSTWTEYRKVLQKYVYDISINGKLAIYWNENGLDAFTEYNREMLKLFNKISVSLTKHNYIPFHFGQAILARYAHIILLNRNILFVTGIDEEEFLELKMEIFSFGAKSVYKYNCSRTAALMDDYSNIKLTIEPDIVFVSAGIGAAKVLFDLKYLNCPVIDIGGYIHVLSGRRINVHGGFFLAPQH